MSVGEEMLAKWVATGLDGDSRAIEKIFEQLEGKATQPISGPENGPVQTEALVNFDSLPNEVVKAIGEILVKVKVG